MGLPKNNLGRSCGKISHKEATPALAKPVSGYLGYDTDADRPTVLLRSGRKHLLTEDDSVGSITEIDSPDGSVTVTNGTGPTVSLSVPSPVLPAFWAHRTGSEVADSDEFTAGTIGSNWSLRRNDTFAVVTPVGGVDPTQAVSVVGSPRFTANYRGTFAAIQGFDTTTQPIGLYRQMSARPADFHIRFRVNMPMWKHIGGSGGTTSARNSVFLVKDNAGVPDGNNFVHCGWIVNGSNQIQAFAQCFSGGSPVVTELGTAFTGPTADCEFIVSMTSASTIACYVRNDVGHTRIISTGGLVIASGQPLWVNWIPYGNVSGGRLVYTCDYILQQNDLVFPV